MKELIKNWKEIEYTCDSCGETNTYEYSFPDDEFDALSEQLEIEEELRAEGWMFDKDDNDTHYCKKCKDTTP